MWIKNITSKWCYIKFLKYIFYYLILLLLFSCCLLLLSLIILLLLNKSLFLFQIECKYEVIKAHNIPKVQYNKIVPKSINEFSIVLGLKEIPIPENDNATPRKIPLKSFPQTSFKFEKYIIMKLAINVPITPAILIFNKLNSKVCEKYIIKTANTKPIGRPSQIINISFNFRPEVKVQARNAIHINEAPKEILGAIRESMQYNIAAVIPTIIGNLEYSKNFFIIITLKNNYHIDMLKSIK